MGAGMDFLPPLVIVAVLCLLFYALRPGGNMTPVLVSGGARGENGPATYHYVHYP